MTAEPHDMSLIHDIGVVGFVVVLPEPPGNNSLYQLTARLSNGRCIPDMKHSKKYAAWIKEAGTLLNVQQTEVMPGPFAVDITVRCDGGCDTDALLKATLDLLRRHKDFDGRPLLQDDTRKYQRHCGVDVFPTELAKDWLEPGEMQVRVRALPERLPSGQA